MQWNVVRRHVRRFIAHTHSHLIAGHACNIGGAESQHTDTSDTTYDQEKGCGSAQLDTSRQPYLVEFTVTLYSQNSLVPCILCSLYVLIPYIFQSFHFDFIKREKDQILLVWFGISFVFPKSF
jgi:hypothetical protein